jgi:hypothetical protein
MESPKEGATERVMPAKDQRQGCAEAAIPAVVDRSAEGRYPVPTYWMSDGAISRLGFIARTLPSYRQS